MARVEQRLEIVPAEQKDIEVVKVQEPEKYFNSSSNWNCVWKNG
jgi:hypothetical protein